MLFRMDAKAFSLYCPCRTSMDTRRLHTFVAVAECGSVSEAARRLHIAQPALSRQLQALEAELRTELLVRSGKGVTLTPAGERLFPYALSVLRQLDAVPEIVADSETKVSGRVAIGLPTTASAVLSKPLLLAAAKELPNVQMHLVESLSGHLTDLVHMGKLDLSLLYDPEPSPHLNLEGILIEELGLSGAAHALPTGLSHIRLDELADYPLAIPASSHSLRRLLDTVSIRHGIRLNIALEVDFAGRDQERDRGRSVFRHPCACRDPSGTCGGPVAQPADRQASRHPVGGAREFGRAGPD